MAAQARAGIRGPSRPHTTSTSTTSPRAPAWRARLRACAAAERVNDLRHVRFDAAVLADADARLIAAAPMTTTTPTPSRPSPPSSETPTPAKTPTRRATLLSALAAALAAATADSLGRATAASAAPLAQSAALPTAPFSFLQPGPVAVPRRTLDLRFAVLLMRAIYDAVDGADAIAMRDFQVLFWKRREGEVEAYSQLVSPLEPRKGDLSDPLYFDFISYSQALAVDAALKGHPPRVFEEEYDECELKPDQDECPILTRVVRRDAPADDADLPSEFWRRAGDLIFEGLAGGFRGEQFEGVPGLLSPGAGADEVVAGFRALLGVLVAKGYALASEVSVVPASPSSSSSSNELELRVTLEGSATQWGSAALASRRSKALTLHEAAALDGWLRAAANGSGGKGWRAESVEAEFGDATRATTWRLVRA